MEEYFVHAIGPDDILGPFDEITAHRKANEVNIVSAEYAKHKTDIIFFIAIVVTCKNKGYEYLKDYKGIE